MKNDNNFNFFYNMNEKVLEVFDKYQEYSYFHSNPHIFASTNGILEFKVLELLENLEFSIEEVGTFFYSEIIVKIINILEVLEETKKMYNNSFFMEDVNVSINELKKKLIYELEDLGSNFYKQLINREISLSFYHSYIKKALPINYSNNSNKLLYVFEDKKSISYGFLAYLIASSIISGNNILSLGEFNIIPPSDQKKNIKIYK